MTRLFLPPSVFERSEAVLDPDASRRLVAVLRLRAGASLRVFDGAGHERVATVVEARRERAVLSLGSAVQALAEPLVPVTLVCAFPRGQRGDWLVEKATELGVARLVPIESERVVMRAGDGRLERWRRIAIEAAEQCGRATVPEIGAIEEGREVGGRGSTGSPRTGEGSPRTGTGTVELVANRGATASIREVLGGLEPRAVAIYIGPEGGWSEAEREEHRAAGRLPVTLGPRTLRVETAALVALAQGLEATGGAIAR